MRGRAEKEMLDTSKTATPDSDTYSTASQKAVSEVTDPKERKPARAATAATPKAR
jgi:hypothetical protein